jgi:hypothetical protein
LICGVIQDVALVLVSMFCNISAYVHTLIQLLVDLHISEIRQLCIVSILQLHCIHSWIYLTHNESDHVALIHVRTLGWCNKECIMKCRKNNHEVNLILARLFRRRVLSGGLRSSRNDFMFNTSVYVLIGTKSRSLIFCALICIEILGVLQ